MPVELHSVIRYLIVCEDIIHLGGASDRVSLINLISAIIPSVESPYPYLMPEFCVYAQATECRVSGEVVLEIVQEDTEDVVLVMPPGILPAQPSPLHVVGLRWRIRGCTFPESGLYGVRLRYNGICLAEQPLLLR